jgi:hypothetical protein
LVSRVSTRRYEATVESAPGRCGVSKSAVSRSFVKASKRVLDELLSRRLDEDRYPAILIDGISYQGEQILGDHRLNHTSLSRRGCALYPRSRGVFSGSGYLSAVASSGATTWIATRKRGVPASNHCEARSAFRRLDSDGSFWT